MHRHSFPLALSLRLRLMLALATVAVFPLAGVSYVVVRDEVGSVTREIDFEARDAALAAQSRFGDLLHRRELAAVAAASSPQLQAAIRKRDTSALRAFARQHDLLLEVAGRRYGRPLRHAATARTSLVRKGRPIGSIVAQLPLDAATLKRVAMPTSPGVRFSFAGLHAVSPAGRGVTLPLTEGAGIRAYLPRRLVSARIDGAYHRVEEAGAFALLSLMLLTFVLARPLLRALRLTERQASEARVDPLTGIANRRGLEEILAAEIARARRFEHPLGVILLDLDHFKQTNDSFGHAAGDLVLRALGRLLTSSARHGDTVARLGGEEFVVVLPETGVGGARRLAERLRREVEAQAVRGIRTTASCGVATVVAGDTVDSLLAAADGALYRAKELGRNRTEVARRGGPSSAAA
ncbi:MAG TPA: GGDEF domain-containing protein [Gaiellaceae bacterium]|jgi:diguanylate cyclase (GGDEF)-like protein|nr:GGDEF domain-containing protein [Gaiellaceae bacterium]